MFTVYSGATNELLTREKKNAVKMVVEMNADKKMEDQASGDPDKEKDKDKLSWF